MSDYEVRIDGLGDIQAAIAAGGDALDPYLAGPMMQLGNAINANMQVIITANNYTGELADSITAEYDDSKRTLTVGPTAMRGRWDGGLILEKGTAPHAAPWAPIAEWANFRGLPVFPVWYKIYTQGTNAYPFLDRTLQTSQADIDEANRQIAITGAQVFLTGRTS